MCEHDSKHHCAVDAATKRDSVNIYNGNSPVTLQFVKSAEIKDERREREREKEGERKRGGAELQRKQEKGDQRGARERVCEGQNTRKECKTKGKNSKDARGLRKVPNNKMEE